MNLYAAYFVPNKVDPMGTDAVACSDGSHAWVEFEFDASMCDPTGMTQGPMPIIVKVEMYGPGWNNKKAGVKGVPGLIGITAKPAYGPNAASLSKTGCRTFAGGPQNAQDLIKWVNSVTGVSNTAANPCDAIAESLDTGKVCNLPGKKDYATYGVPAVAGARGQCATFAAHAICEYTDGNWYHLFPPNYQTFRPDDLLVKPRRLFGR